MTFASEAAAASSCASHALLPFPLDFWPIYGHVPSSSAPPSGLRLAAFVLRPSADDCLFHNNQMWATRSGKS